MTDIENYHNWLRDAHAMEKQAESLLVATIRRLDNEPQLRTRPAGYHRPQPYFPFCAEGCDEPDGGVRTDHWHHAAR